MPTAVVTKCAKQIVSKHKMGRSGPKAEFRFRNGRVAGSRPKSMEDSPCIQAHCTSNVPRIEFLPLVWCRNFEKDVPAQVFFKSFDHHSITRSVPEEPSRRFKIGH
ncbi:hypothetical protein AVEN_260430-1 [Araneus ventricosus]|uniref:Uncharacterized protein n=1 Tax=Araneus ventricosus TaxID=182803 RepID=A0A4Y2KCK4_ARAVE|nr:hypothetical protein AVEN_260430-1 [Araneus ventricosus]